MYPCRTVVCSRLNGLTLLSHCFMYRYASMQCPLPSSSSSLTVAFIGHPHHPSSSPSSSRAPQWVVLMTVSCRPFHHTMPVLVGPSMMMMTMTVHHKDAPPLVSAINIKRSQQCWHRCQHIIAFACSPVNTAREEITQVWAVNQRETCWRADLGQVWAVLRSNQQWRAADSWPLLEKACVFVKSKSLKENSNLKVLR